MVLDHAQVDPEPMQDEQAADAVGAVVNAGSVATQRDVAGQLVDLVAQSERGAPPELRAEASAVASTGCGKT